MQCVRCRSGLQRIIPAGVIDVDRAYFDAVLAGVAHDLGGCIEAHRLAVQQRRREYVGIAALHPGGRIDKVREARGVAFRKTIFAEALDLVEAAFGEIAWIAARRHALDQLVAEILDGADTAERRHGAAQLVGLGRREASGDDRDAHRLLLEQRHAECLAEHLLEFVRVATGGRRRRELDLLHTLPAPQVGMHHVALDRPRAHDRDLDDEVIKFVRLEPRQHRHLGAALDLEYADRIGARQHAVDLGLLRRNSRQRELLLPSPLWGGVGGGGRHGLGARVPHPPTPHPRPLPTRGRGEESAASPLSAAA